MIRPPTEAGGADRVGANVTRWVRAIEEWTDWLRAAGKSAETVRLRRYQLTRLAEAHLRRSPWRVTTADLAGWLAGHDWSPGTRHGYRAAVCSFYRWARIAGHVRRDPAEALPPVRRPRRLPRPAPADVVARVLADADDRVRLAVLLGLYAGLRRGEIARLTWRQVGPDALNVTGKGGHQRRVPLHPALAPELAREWALRRNGMMGTGWRYRPTTGLTTWVFPGKYGRGADPDQLTKAVSAALGDGWTLHTLRHAFATRALAGTGNLAAVQDLLGHATPVTTRIYTYVSDDALRAAVLTV